MEEKISQKRSKSKPLIILGAALVLIAAGLLLNSLKTAPNQPGLEPGKDLIVQPPGPEAPLESEAEAAERAALEKAAAEIEKLAAKRTLLKVKAEKGQFTPKELRVKKGQTVEIEFTAADDKYDIGFVDPKIGFDMIVEKGGTQSFGFETEDKPAGAYKFTCFEFCPRGAMDGVLIIE